jgi:hypothetical protein
VAPELIRIRQITRNSAFIFVIKLLPNNAGRARWLIAISLIGSIALAKKGRDRAGHAAKRSNDENAKALHRRRR